MSPPMTLMLASNKLHLVPISMEGCSASQSAALHSSSRHLSNSSSNPNATGLCMRQRGTSVQPSAAWKGPENQAAASLATCHQNSPAPKLGTLQSGPNPPSSSTTPTECCQATKVQHLRWGLHDSLLLGCADPSMCAAACSSGSQFPACPDWLDAWCSTVRLP